MTKFAVVGLNAPFPNDPDIDGVGSRTRYVHLGSDDGQNGIVTRESKHNLSFRYSLTTHGRTQILRTASCH